MRPLSSASPSRPAGAGPTRNGPVSRRCVESGRRQGTVRKREEYPEWFVWLWEKGFRLLVLLGLIALGLLLLLSDTTDERLSAIEAKLSEAPARTYQPPDLEGFATKIDTASLPVHDAAYVPAYSHIYFEQGRPYPLEVTLNIRNTDVDRPLYLKSVRYYDSSGSLEREFLNDAVRLPALQTLEFLVSRQDTAGRSGASFIVEWAVASTAVDPPMIEAVMMGSLGTSAIAFTRSSQPIHVREAD